jgi:hypothetical protein
MVILPLRQISRIWSSSLVQHLDKSFDLAFDAGHLNRQRLRRQVHDAGAKDLGQLEDLGTIAAAWRPP